MGQVCQDTLIQLPWIIPHRQDYEMPVTCRGQENLHHAPQTPANSECCSIAHDTTSTLTSSGKAMVKGCLGCACWRKALGFCSFVMPWNKRHFTVSWDGSVSRDISRFFPQIDQIFSWEALNPFCGNFVLDNCILYFDAERVHLKLQVINLKNKEATGNPKPQTLENIGFSKPCTRHPKP